MIDPDEDVDGVRLPEGERRALWREANGVSAPLLTSENRRPVR